MGHLHIHRDRVVGSKRSEALGLFRLHKLIVLALVHSIGVKSPPETFVDFLNLLG